MKLWVAGGQPIELGRELGRGGEGVVYTLPSLPQHVVKVYAPDLRAARARKIAAMVTMRSADLQRFAAWPNEIVFEDPAAQRPCGFTMPRVPDHYFAAHRLYSPADRRRDFPTVDWRFLVAASANLCAAVQSLHAHGHVLGDINHSNVLISKRALVHLIDIDSIQVQAGAQRFLCEVGVPEFTPPELQGQSLRGLVRTTNHDAFGLAVMIFQLLFMGRHPFSGVHPGAAPTLGEAIQNGHFAYMERGGHVRRPPGSMPLSTAGTELAELFLRAFSPTGRSRTSRPDPEEWRTALIRGEKAVVRCRKQSRHFFLPSPEGCPWCGLDSAGFEFFPPSERDAFSEPEVSGRTINEQALEQMWRRVLGVQKARTAITLSSPRTEEPIRVPDPPRPMAGGIGGTIAGWSVIALIIVPPVGLAGLVLGAAYGLLAHIVNGVAATRHRADPKVARLVQAQAKERELRSLIEQRQRALAHARSEYERKWDAIASRARSAKSKLDQVTAEAIQRTAHIEVHADERARYLRNALIHEASIKGIGASLTSALRSFGFETALDVIGKERASHPASGSACPRCGGPMVASSPGTPRPHLHGAAWICSRYPSCFGTSAAEPGLRGRSPSQRLQAVPGIGPTRAQCILEWAEAVERRFRPAPAPTRLAAAVQRLTNETDPDRRLNLQSLSMAADELIKLNRSFESGTASLVEDLRKADRDWQGLREQARASR